MSIKILYGPSGHGKTEYVYSDIIKEACANPDKKYVFIVPEQSSLQAQKRVVRMHPSHGVFNIDVLTFGRLCYRVFEELQIELKETIDDTGKNLIVRKILNNVKSDFRIIKSGKRQGFVSEMKSMISELKQYGITPDMLKEIAGNTGSDRLRDKLEDISLIYGEFENYIKDRFVTVEDKPELLYKCIDNSDLLKGSTVVFDGFTGFTPVQYRLIEKMALQAENIIVTVTLSSPAINNINTDMGMDELFYMSKDMIRKLGVIADNARIPFLMQRIESDYTKYRFRNSPALNFLEENIFRYNGSTFDGSTEDIHISEHLNSKEEIQYAAAAILKEVRTHGYRFNDIGVILGDKDNSANETARIFKESGIPFFMDNKRSIIGNPLVEYIRGMIALVKERFSYEAVFRVLKNGLCGFERDKVNIFEDYVLAFGIKGYDRYCEKFVRTYKSKETGLDVINEVREDFYCLISEFYNDMTKGTKALDYVNAVYDFMEKENLYEEMEILADKTEDEDKAEEYRKSYGHVVTLLERIYDMLGDEPMTVKEFTEIMDAGFEEIKVGIIPPSNDCVTVGDLERSRIDNIKVLFVLGANEGIIPKTGDNHGILSEEERMTLSDMQIVLSPTPKEKVFMQNFYLYLNLTRPENTLYLSYGRYNDDGKEIRPSRVIGIISDMYGIKPYHPDITDYLTNRQNSFHLVSDYAKIKAYDTDKNLAAIISYFVNDDVYGKVIKKIVDSFNDSIMSDNLTKESAKMLYSENLTASVSRIETYAGCAFSHFLTYGLEIGERQEHKITNIDIGDIFHKALEYMGCTLMENGLNFGSLSDEERRDFVNVAFDKITTDYKYSFFKESAANEFLKMRLSDIVNRTVWALGEQINAGSFVPAAFEHNFIRNINGMTVNGKIDRIDIASENGSNYIKIIDYKSGENTISKEEILTGEKLQLLIYLDEALKEYEKDGVKAVPSAVFYNTLKDPVTDKKDVLQDFIPSGIVGYDSIGLLDHNMDKESNVIPVKKGRDNNVAYSDKVVTNEQFMEMAAYASRRMSELVEEMISGRIAINPYEGACDFCKYSDICGFNVIKKDKCRVREKISLEDFFAKIGLENKKDE